jgi:hypothetical protein
MGLRRTGRYGFGPHWTIICTTVTMLTTICTIKQTMIDMRSLRSLAAKHVIKKDIIPVRDTMAEETAIG